MSITSRPSQYKQSSRKGRKAWRKNIDISDIEQGLQDESELEITHGIRDISKLHDDKLFTVDEEGDLDLKAKLIKKKQIKKNVKSKEILDSVNTNSKIEALRHPKLSSTDTGNNIQNVSRRELQKLLNLAGKNIGESKWKNRIAKEGLIKSGSFDIWGPPSNANKITTRAGIEVQLDPNKGIFKNLIEQSTTGWSLPSRRPKTLIRAPEKVQDFDELPHAGKSYNPNEKDWNELITTQYNHEKAKEDNRLSQREYSARIAHLMELIGESEEEESDSSEEQKDDIERGTEEEDLKLSTNEAVRNKKKTRHQRNKAKRHEERMKMQTEVKRLKSRLHELESLEGIQKDLEGNKASRIHKTKRNKKRRLGTRFSAREANLEVKISDELSGSLRKLKPEGNLLYDQMRILQSSGKVETRIPVHKSGKNKSKITEKWTYKDFK